MNTISTRWPRWSGERIMANRWDRATVETRFWEKVDKTSGNAGCWLWVGAGTGTGYGHFMERPGREVRAHRFSWQLANGPVPHGMCVLHRCDNPSCVNPAHLWLGTQLENVADMVRKGRAQRVSGEQRPCARLTEADVHAIRTSERYKYSASMLARHYGVGRTTIRHVIAGTTWKHLDAEGRPHDQG